MPITSYTSSDTYWSMWSVLSRCWLCNYRCHQHRHFLQSGGCGKWKSRRSQDSGLVDMARRKWLHHFLSKWQCWLALHWRCKSECVMHDHRTVRQSENLRKTHVSICTKPVYIVVTFAVWIINSNVESPESSSCINYWTSVNSCWAHCVIPSTQDDWFVTAATVNASTHAFLCYFNTIWKFPHTMSLPSCCSGAAFCTVSQAEQSTTALSYVTKQHYTVVTENSTIQEEIESYQIASMTISSDLGLVITFIFWAIHSYVESFSWICWIWYLTSIASCWPNSIIPST